MKKTISVTLIGFLSLLGCTVTTKKTPEEIKSYFESKEFKIDTISGIGFEKGVTRRDNSDVVKIGTNYYVYYTKVFGQSPGYWGTIWTAVSADEGHTWTELGEVLGVGEKGQWDSQATFTPNILEEKGVYYLYYTAVQPTPTNEEGKFENNSINDYTAIGVAKSDSPSGPFVRCDKNPIITASDNHNLFDSYRVDDAVLLKKERKFWLYFKGRKYADGQGGPAHTQMGVAFANSPEGPYEKYEKNPILSKSHEVFLWKQNKGVACLASISSTIEYAPDGLDFSTEPISVAIDRKKRPNAPGAFRPDLAEDKENSELTWGISMIHNGADSYLVRWKLVTKK